MEPMEILKDHKIQTNRCVLRKVSREDIPHVFSASRVKGFTDGMLWEPPEYESDLVETFERSIARWEKGTDYSFTIEDKLSKSFIGRISIRKEDTEENLWDVGFWTHPVSKWIFAALFLSRVGSIIREPIERRKSPK